MARSVENPFKERRIPKWIRYGIIIGFVGMLIVWFLFGGSSTTSTTSLSSSSSSSSSSIKSYTENSQNLRHRPANNVNKVGDIGAAVVVDQDDYDEEEEEENKNGDEEEEDDSVIIGRSRSRSGSRSSSDEEEQEIAEDTNDDHEQNDDHDIPNNDDKNDESGESGDQNEQFPLLAQEDYFGWLRSYSEALEFEPPQSLKHKNNDKLTEPLLTESLQLGCDYIAANQKKHGNFNYQYDFVTKEMDANDSPVRQAGALWGMTLCFQSQPENTVYKKAVEKGILFFQRHLADGPVPGSRMVQYPNFDDSQTGVNALWGLSLIDYIRTIRDNEMTTTTVDGDGLDIKDLEVQLDMTIQFLKFMQDKDLHFSAQYDLIYKVKSQQSSSYFDGETMLCLVKAAKYMGEDSGYAKSLVPIIEKAAPVMAKAYTVDAWRNDEHDSDETKGFYQWSSMFFTEYYYAQWENYEFFGDYVVMMAHWVIHTHGILNRNRNTGYAYEGIISAYQIAKTRGYKDALLDMKYTIDEGLYNLGRWQVGGPLADTNEFLVKNRTNEKIAVGGVMNAKQLSPLRIDTTQHQMHAVMMALETIYK